MIYARTELHSPLFSATKLLPFAVVNNKPYVAFTLPLDYLIFFKSHSMIHVHRNCSDIILMGK